MSLARFFVSLYIGAVTAMRGKLTHGSTTRDCNSGAEQNDVMFGVCYPNRLADRMAYMCLLPNRVFWSAFCWAASFTDDPAKGTRARAQHAVTWRSEPKPTIGVHRRRGGCVRTSDRRPPPPTQQGSTVSGGAAATPWQLPTRAGRFGAIAAPKGRATVPDAILDQEYCSGG